MAYNLESLVKILEQILHPDNHCRWTLDSSKKPQIESLLKKALFLKLCFEKISLVSSDETESLESRIRDAAHEAEDILESLLADQVHSVRQGESFMISPQGLQKVIEEFDSAEEDIKKIMDDRNQLSKISLPAVSPMVDPNVKNIIVGIDEGSTQLKDRLTRQESKLEIIPIVGMGGIGKTTLAQNVYDDPFVVSHFDTRAWITISQHKHKDENNLKRILTSLLGCVIEKLTDEMLQEKNDQLAVRLHKSLKGRRYLIVLDDMWITDDWDDIKRYLPDDENGSRIIVTTRETDVANYAGPNGSHHQMQLLDKDESWNLLRQKVFVQETCPPELEEIGKKIAENCRGLPLAVHVIGGVLSQGKRTVESWWRVAKDVSSTVANKDEQFSKILSLSYNHLPIHLKPCFLYMGAFREDADIRGSKLIRLWVAEGFLKPIPGKTLEEAADMYLKALVDRNLIYVRQKVTNGIVKSYSIHDLLRDLCVRKACQEKFLHVKNGQKSNLPEDTVCLRRVSADSSYCTRYGCSLGKITMTGARSFLHTGDGPCYQIVSVVSRLRLLKVLDVVRIRLRTFPVEILQLINLRYLAFRGCSLVTSSISSLENLETIIFACEDILTTLNSGPFSAADIIKAILDMPRLRHVKIKNTFYPCHLRDGECVALKENLQSVSGIVIDVGFVQLLKSVPNLKKLGVFRSTWPVFSDNIDLSFLLKLETFKCCSSSSYMYEFSNFFIFPPSLKNLSLTSFEILPQYLNVIGSLPNLQVLKLRDCEFEIPKWEPVEGEFRQLHFLLLEGMIDLEHWVADETNFPRLERLVIRYCSQLKGIPIGIGDIPTLQIIEVHGCSTSAMGSARKIQEEQLEFGNYGLEVRITGR